MQTSIRPRSLHSAYVAEFLRRIVSAEQSLAHLPRAPGDITLRRNYVVSMLAEYRRSIRTLQWVPDFSPPDLFNEHDQLASILLYEAARFEALRDDHGCEIASLLGKIRKEAGTLDHKVINLLEDKFPVKMPRTPRYQLGILTVLEQEYQSVVRRLDKLELCSDVSCFGQAILDRRQTFQNLKPRAGTGRGLGWAKGTIGDVTLCVICTGDMGKDSTYLGLNKALEIVGPPVDGWYVVGVCAGTNEQWPLGTVLVSKDKIFDVVYKHASAKKFTILKPIKPRPVHVGQNVFQVNDLFRRIPTGKGLGVHIAQPTSVPVNSVKFACTNVVIDDTGARDRLRARLTLLTRGLAKDEDFGIEMEAKGVFAFGGAPVRIVKAVCDYADGRKGGVWTDEQKMEIQLYASELAADFVSNLIRRPGTQAPSGTLPNSPSPS